MAVHETEELEAEKAAQIESVRNKLASVAEQPGGLNEALAYVREPCACVVHSLRAGQSDEAAKSLQSLYSAVLNAPSSGLKACVDEVLLPAKLALQAHFKLSEVGPTISLPSFATENALKVVSSTITRAHCTEEFHSDAGIMALQLGALASAKAIVTEEGVRTSAAYTMQAGARLAASRLASPDEAATLGHAISSALSIVSTEDSCGTAGSKDARFAALRCARTLIEATASADALGFFLPGTSSGFAKALAAAHPKKASPASASAGSSATAEALRALSSLIVCVLNDKDNTEVSRRPRPYSRNSDALQQLHKFSRSLAPENAEDAPLHKQKTDEAADAKAAYSKNNGFRITRDAAWLQNVEQKLCELSEEAVRPIVCHNHARVRVAYAEAAGNIVAHCTCTIPNTCRSLLEDLLPLVSDGFPQVRAEADRQLERLQRTRGEDMLNAAVPVALESLRALDKQSRKADKTAFISSAKRLKTAVQMLQPEQGAVSRGVIHELNSEQLWSVLESCFWLKSRKARTVLHLDVNDDVVNDDRADQTALLPCSRVEDLECLETEDARDAAIDACRSVGHSAMHERLLPSLARDFVDRLQNKSASTTHEKSRWYKQRAALLKAGAEFVVGAACTCTSHKRSDLVESIAVMHSAALCSTVWCPNLDTSEDEALLATQACEFLGACARVLGNDYQERADLLATSLPKLLRRLGSADSELSHAAASTLMQIGAATGSGPSLRSVVSAHSDYVVDALSSQLRRLGDNPHAPKLFAAALERAGASRDLLPLLAEPLEHAAQAVSAMGRKKLKAHTLPFLGMLREVSKAAEVEASTLAKKAAEEQHEQLQLPPDDIRRVEIAAKAAARVAYASAPSARDRNLRTRLRAMECTQHALRALRIAVDVGAADEFGAPRKRAADAGFESGGWGLGSYQRSTPDQAQRSRAELMPAVVASWPTIIAALKDRHPEGVRCACEMLCDACEAAGGSFLARRVADEAMPELLRLLDHGMQHTREEDVNEEWWLAQQSRVRLPETTSGRATDKTRVAVLHALNAIASSPRACEALLDSLTYILNRIPPLLADDCDTDVRRSAAEALHALHEFDPDVLHVALAEAAFASSRDPQYEQHDRPAAPHPSLPSHRNILPPSGNSCKGRGAARNAGRLLDKLSACDHAPRWARGS